MTLFESKSEGKNLLLELETNLNRKKASLIQISEQDRKV